MQPDLELLLDQLAKTELEINGKVYQIPAGQPLLRALQYLELKGVSIEVTRGPFCWNGDCKSCVCDFEAEGQQKTGERVCRFRVKGPVKMNRINDNFKFHS